MAAKQGNQMTMIGSSNKVVGTKLKINGLNGDPQRPMDIGEKIFIVAEVSVSGVEFQEEAIGVTRLHKARIWRYAEMDNDAAQEVLNAAAEQARRAADEEAGVTPLFGGGFGGPFGNPGDHSPEDDPEDATPSAE